MDPSAVAAEQTPSPKVRKRKPGGGRKPIFSEGDRVIIRAIGEADPGLSLRQLVKLVEQATGKRVSTDTIGASLRSMGLTYKRRPPTGALPASPSSEKADPTSKPAGGEKPAAPARYTARHRTKGPPAPPHRASYSSDLTDGQWALIEALFRREARELDQARQGRRIRVVGHEGHRQVKAAGP